MDNVVGKYRVCAMLSCGLSRWSVTKERCISAESLALDSLGSREAGQAFVAFDRDEKPYRWAMRIKQNPRRSAFDQCN